jgi:Flavin containing amine oxidoreductase
VGGRLQTFTFNHNGHLITVELGGMRFQRGHRLVWQLVEQLGLHSLARNFLLSYDRLYYLRSTRIWESELKTSSCAVKLPYALPADSQYKTPDDLFNWVVTKATKSANAPNWSIRQWQDFVQNNVYSSPTDNSIRIYEKQAFCNVGFWNLLYEHLGNEGYRFVTEGGGYDSNTINWNAALAMPYVTSGDYSPDAEYYYLAGGNEQLPKALAAAGGAHIHFGIQLERLERGQGGLVQCTFTNGTHRGTFLTKHLILAMPRRSLELLDQSTEFFCQLAMSRLLETIIPQPSCKLCLLFDQPWWKNVEIRGRRLTPYGPTVTDLPLRMIWYFDEDHAPGERDALLGRKNSDADCRQKSGCWVLLASYSDMTNQQFWSTMTNQSIFESRHSDSIQYSNSNLTSASAEMIKMALLQLEEVHGVAIPHPISAEFQNWGADPYGAGYHA